MVWPSNDGGPIGSRYIDQILSAKHLYDSLYDITAKHTDATISLVCIVNVYRFLLGRYVQVVGPPPIRSDVELYLGWMKGSGVPRKKHPLNQATNQTEEA